VRSRHLHIVLPLLCTSISLLAQQRGTDRDSTGADTTRTYRARGIVVEGSSLLSRVAQSAQPLALVTRAQIDEAAAIDLGDAVAIAPGAFVKRYGGLGGLQTVSLRGTSSQQTVLLIDGVRYQNSSSGGFDLGNIPAASIERVEVVRGGNAALYGANALGGAINVITRPSGSDRFEVEASSTIGSFGEQGYGASLSGGDERSAWDGSFRSTVASGGYPFSFNEYGEESRVQRENADFSNLFGRAAWSYRFGEKSRLSLASQAFRSERGVPGAVVQGSREQLHARLDERDIFGVATIGYSPDEWEGFFSASGRVNSLYYRDPDARLSGPKGIDDRYDRREGTATMRVRRTVGAIGMIEALGEFSYAELKGNNLDPAAGASVYRTEWSGAILSNWLFEHALFDADLSLDGGVRFDHFSDVEPAVSPSLGVVLHPDGSPLRMRAHGSLNYRVPSFSEQYYLNYGNTGLRPERSKSIDIGATYQAGEALVLESTLFLIDTRDQIVSVPISPVRWSAANVGRVLSRGIELAASGSLFDGVTDLHASYTLARSEDRSGGSTDGKLLVYSPEELVNGVVGVHLGDYTVGISWQHISHRFTLPLNPAESALPAYGLLGANVSGRWAFGPMNLLFKVEGLNLLDGEYQVVRNYPMPGRMFRIGVDLHYTGR
jgi:outer membrane cobalamin receptor